MVLLGMVNNFITTHPNVLNKQNKSIKNIHFFFVPVDKNIECFDVFKLNPDGFVFMQ